MLNRALDRGRNCQVSPARPRTAVWSGGFTLIEIMIAIAILALILVMLAGSFHAVATGKVHAESRLALDQEGRVILSEISSEIRGAVQTPLIPSRTLLLGEGRMQNAVPVDSISVSSLEPGHRRAVEGFGAEDTVTYVTEPNPDHPGWFRLRRTQSSSLLGIGTGDSARTSLVIADNLLSLHIKYFDGTDWKESWNSQSLPPGQELPEEVAIDIALAPDVGVPLTLSTMVVPPMAFQQW
jgi:prepilin-type N-terminal cleavage/methylation domain-containing protein